MNASPMASLLRKFSKPFGYSNGVRKSERDILLSKVGGKKKTCQNKNKK